MQQYRLPDRGAAERGLTCRAAVLRAMATCIDGSWGDGVGPADADVGQAEDGDGDCECEWACEWAEDVVEVVLMDHIEWAEFPELVDETEARGRCWANAGCGAPNCTSAARRASAKSDSSSPGSETHLCLSPPRG